MRKAKGQLEYGIVSEWLEEILAREIGVMNWIGLKPSVRMGVFLLNGEWIECVL